MLELNYLKPNWPAPKQVRAYMTTRLGGYSEGKYGSNNLAEHVADNLEHVSKNRARLLANLRLIQTPAWLNQTHSAISINANLAYSKTTADASFTRQTTTICAILTADCLPILICNKAGTEVAAIHAGWRGLAAGIIPNTLKQLHSTTHELMVWLGPAIGPTAFEVGPEVRDIFISQDPHLQNAFRVSANNYRWLANLYQIATHIFINHGVTAIYQDPICTYNHPELFYSHRRDGQTGRMASLIWFE